MSDFWIGMGFVAHYERKGSGVGDGMGGSIVREFCHGEKFRPFRKLVLCKNAEVCLEFLIYSFGFTVCLQTIYSRKGHVIFEEAGKFLGKSQGELRASVRDDSVMKTKSGEDMVEKDVGDVSSRGGFVARVEIYPL